MRTSVISLVSVWCDNETLFTLSRTPLWPVIRERVRCGHWWYLRTQTLFPSLSIEFDPHANWRNAYYALLYVVSPSETHEIEDPYIKLCQAPVLVIESAAVKITLSVYDPTEHGSRLLFSACCRGWTEIVRLLLTDKRVDLRDCIVQGYDCLDVACVRDHVAIVRLLLADERITSECAEIVYFYRGCVMTEAMQIAVDHFRTDKEV